MREIHHGISYPKRAPKSRKSPRGFLPPGPELRATQHDPVTACCALTTQGNTTPFLSIGDDTVMHLGQPHHAYASIHSPLVYDTIPRLFCSCPY
jgi:hypothetical protein